MNCTIFFMDLWRKRDCRSFRLPRRLCSSQWRGERLCSSQWLGKERDCRALLAMTERGEGEIAASLCSSQWQREWLAM